jgi:hypothetical protein
MNEKFDIETATIQTASSFDISVRCPTCPTCKKTLSMVDVYEEFLPAILGHRTNPDYQMYISNGLSVQDKGYILEQYKQYKQADPTADDWKEKHWRAMDNLVRFRLFGFPR